MLETLESPSPLLVPLHFSLSLGSLFSETAPAPAPRG